jgi:ATP synthase protein I
MAEDDQERLARLRKSLDRARATRETDRRTSAPDRLGERGGDSGLSLAMRAGSEFVAAIVVGAGIGWALDHFIGTNPLFLIAFFFIGVAAGVWNVIKLTSPKGEGLERDSRLSAPEATDKGLRRSGPGSATDALHGPRAPGGISSAVDADDDED